MSEKLEMLRVRKQFGRGKFGPACKTEDIVEAAKFIEKDREESKDKSPDFAEEFWVFVSELKKPLLYFFAAVVALFVVTTAISIGSAFYIHQQNSAVNSFFTGVQKSKKYVPRARGKTKQDRPLKVRKEKPRYRKMVPGEGWK